MHEPIYKYSYMCIFVWFSMSQCHQIHQAFPPTLAYSMQHTHCDLALREWVLNASRLM